MAVGRTAVTILLCCLLHSVKNELSVHVNAGIDLISHSSV